jgi:flagellar motor switch protein FliN
MADEMNPAGPGGAAQNANEEVSWEAAFDEVSAPNAAAGGGAQHEPVANAGAGAVGVDSVVAHEGPLDLNFLLDIPLSVTVEIGRTRMAINDLLQLGQGSVIPLDKLVGEPFEVLVNQKLMARGEVVVVNEKFGVRLTDIIDPKERIQQLG